VQLCDDRTGQPAGACVASSSCACDLGGCAACALSFRATADATRKSPCAPGVGKLHLPNCIDGATCNVEVLSATSPWVGYISAMPASEFTTKLSGVVGQVYIELKLSGTSDVMAQGGDSAGSLNLLVTQNNQSVLLPVDIQLLDGGLVNECQAITGTTLFAMTCTP